MDAQEELDSYKGTMRNNCGLGRWRVPAEFSEIGKTNGSMAGLVRISKKQSSTTEFSGNGSTMFIQQISWGLAQRYLYCQLDRRATMEKGEVTTR